MLERQRLGVETRQACAQAHSILSNLLLRELLEVVISRVQRWESWIVRPDWKSVGVVISMDS